MRKFKLLFSVFFFLFNFCFLMGCTYAKCTISKSVFEWPVNEYTLNNDGNLTQVNYNKVDVKKYRTIKMENESVSIEVIPDLGGRIISLKDKETNKELLYLPAQGIPYGIGKPYFYYRWLMVPGGIFTGVSEAEHGKSWLSPWDAVVLKDTPQVVSLQLSFYDNINIPWIGDLVYGKTLLAYTVTISLYADKKFVEYHVKVNNPRNTTQRYEVWTGVTMPDRNLDNPESNGAHVVMPIERIVTKDTWWPWLQEAEKVIDQEKHLYEWKNLEACANWIGYGIANPLIEDSPMWWAVVDYEKKNGLLCLRKEDNLKKGIKLWSWGYKNAFTASYHQPLFEIWNGVSEEFKVPTTIGPCETQEWTLYYYPLTQSGSITENVLLPESKELKRIGVPSRLGYYRNLPWVFEKVIDKELNESGYPRRKISLLYQGGYYQKCRALIRKSLKLYPQSAQEAHPVMVGTFLMEDNFEEAEKYFISKMGVSDPAVFLKEMVNYYDERDHSEKLAKLDKYINRYHEAKYRHYVCDYYIRHRFNAPICKEIISYLAGVPELYPHYQYYKGCLDKQENNYDVSILNLEASLEKMDDKWVKVRTCDELVYNYRKIDDLQAALNTLKRKSQILTEQTLSAVEPNYSICSLPYSKTQMEMDQEQIIILFDMMYLASLKNQTPIPVGSMKEQTASKMDVAALTNEEKEFWLRHCDSRYNFEEAEKFPRKDAQFWVELRKILE